MFMFVGMLVLMVAVRMTFKSMPVAVTVVVRMWFAVVMVVPSVVMMMAVLVMGMRFVFVVVLQMNIELHSGDARFEAARRVQVIAVKPEFLKFVLELVGIDAKIDQ